MEGGWPESDARYESCLICPKCNIRSCRRWKSSKPHSLNRVFYTCPAPDIDHKFFKWADEVKPHEFIQVPYCGGCSAGVCRVKRETRGPNAGRIMFTCTIKEGDGSCGYKVWQDELKMSEAARAEESRQRDEETDSIFRELITSETMDHEVISREMDQIKYPV